jgi:hypothetical protein
VLWDGETYCFSCVDSVDPELAEYARTHTELAETVTAEDLRFWRIYTNPMGIGFSMIIFGPMFVILCVLFATAENEVGICCGFSCMGGILFFMALFLVVFESDYEQARSGLPRTVRVDGQKLVIETPHESLSITLARCDWYPSYSDVIGGTDCLPRRPAIIIYHSKNGYLAVGLIPEMYRVWYAFLTLARVRNRGRFPWLRLLMAWMVGIPTGLGIGVGLGMWLKEMTGDDLLPIAWGLLGTLDGFLIPIFFILGRWFGAVKGNRRTRSWKFAGRYALAFGMLGLFVAGGRGVGLLLLPGLTLIMLNTCIGFFVGWWCGRSTSPPAKREGGQV